MFFNCIVCGGAYTAPALHAWTMGPHLSRMNVEQRWLFPNIRDFPFSCSRAYGPWNVDVCALSNWKASWWETQSLHTAFSFKCFAVQQIVMLFNANVTPKELKRINRAPNKIQILLQQELKLRYNHHCISKSKYKKNTFLFKITWNLKPWLLYEPPKDKLHILYTSTEFNAGYTMAKISLYPSSKKQGFSLFSNSPPHFFLKHLPAPKMSLFNVSSVQM